MSAVVSAAVGLVVVGTLMETLQRLIPAIEARRRRWRLDLAWWFFTAILGKPLVRVALILALAPPVLALSLPRGPDLFDGHGPLASLSVWIQLPLVMLLSDLVNYGMHRIHHRTGLWRTHAIHHSSEHLDWLAAARVHPVNAMLQRSPGVLIGVLLGFDLRLVASTVPLIGIWAVLIHANVDLRLGPLRYLVATPAFHRWHHARSGAPVDGCNFAGLFPVWDLLFGTFHLPPDDAEDFGVSGPGPPEGLWAQLIWPFVRTRRQSRSSSA